MKKAMVGIIAAFGNNRAIGKNNTLLWHISDDLKRFKELTTGHPIIMGRKTFESIGKPLPGRDNIVITRDHSWKQDGVKVAYSFLEALDIAQSLHSEEIFVIGGAQIYEQALPFTDKLYLTLIDDEKEGDVFFPDYSEFTKKTFEEKRMDEKSGLTYIWINLERK